ncbi:hypothetical protein AVEN_258125-1 [Araneus ventricosus]|uniref:Uncharacterized protein n=1 Tax=Araneus ventricosus TaxID=182803 RepID=A0A4Y2PK81_ARAVE|nr:hypothetical protein AVEN_164958-1 [Araneus ventricosus]GBN52449.1 hypothetical protein AVEN_258125-1 [Araneus ventricosus]
MREIPLPSSKTTLTAGTVRISRKSSFSANPSGRATLTKKVCSAGEKPIALNERGVEISQRCSDVSDGHRLLLEETLGTFPYR